MCHITCLKYNNLGRSWWNCCKVGNATFFAGFCLKVGKHERIVTAEFRRNAIIPWMFLESFDCRSWMAGKIQKGFHSPCKKKKSLYRTTQHLESRNHKSNDWHTNSLIHRPGHIFLHWVFLRLRIQIEDRFLPCLFLFDPFFLPFFFLVKVLACNLVGKKHPFGSHHCLLTSPSCLSFLWTTKLGPLLAAIKDLAFVHHRRILFQFLWVVPCLFPSPFFFFFSPGGS